MRDDWRFEIERAFDILPHAAGASWAAVWFRTSGVKSPSAEEFRAKTAEYFDMLKPLFSSYPEAGEFAEMNAYIRRRYAEERNRIVSGDNEEIEKRHKRYVDYG